MQEPAMGKRLLHSFLEQYLWEHAKINVVRPSDTEVSSNHRFPDRF
jgi:hypothetical protein